MDEVRLHRPVRAGDTLSATVELAGNRAGDAPEFGHTRAAVTTTNGDGETVLTTTGLGLVAKRT